MWDLDEHELRHVFGSLYPEQREARSGDFWKALESNIVESGRDLHLLRLTRMLKQSPIRRYVTRAGLGYAAALCFMLLARILAGELDSSPPVWLEPSMITALVTLALALEAFDDWRTRAELRAALKTLDPQGQHGTG